MRKLQVVLVRDAMAKELDIEGDDGHATLHQTIHERRFSALTSANRGRAAKSRAWRRVFIDVDDCDVWGGRNTAPGEKEQPKTDRVFKGRYSRDNGKREADHPRQQPERCSPADAGHGEIAARTAHARIFSNPLESSMGPANIVAQLHNTKFNLPDRQSTTFTITNGCNVSSR